MITMEEHLNRSLRTGHHVWPLVAGRIYPLVLPEGGTLPAVIWARVSGVRQYSHAGSSQLDDARVQVTAWGNDYAEAKDVARAVQTDLEDAGFRLVNEVDLPEPNTETYQVALDFRIGHHE